MPFYRNWVSYSKLRAFQECGKQYDLQYVQKVKDVPPPLERFAVGSVVHKALEIWRRDGKVTGTQFGELCLQYRLNGENRQRNAAVAIRESIALVKELDLTEAEWEFRFKSRYDRDTLLNGSIDIYAGDSVWDLKTSTAGAQQSDRVQLLFYALALEAGGRPAPDYVGVLSPAATTKVTRWEVSADDLQRTEAMLQAYLSEQYDRERLTTARPGRACLFCRYNRTKYCRGELMLAEVDENGQYTFNPGGDPPGTLGPEDDALGEAGGSAGAP